MKKSILVHALKSLETNSCFGTFGAKAKAIQIGSIVCVANVEIFTLDGTNERLLRICNCYIASRDRVGGKQVIVDDPSGNPSNCLNRSYPKLA